MGTFTYKGNTKTYHSISDNIHITSVKFKYNDGLFGDKGKAKIKSGYYRQILSNDPISTAKEFYSLIAKGGIENKLPNNKGLFTKLKDGTIIVFREITSTPNSPAVEINIKGSNTTSGIKGQKIHFEKKE